MKIRIIKHTIACLLINLSITANGQPLRDEQNFQAYFNEATKNFLLGRYVQAVNLYKECVRIKPEAGTAYFQLSKIYLSAGNIELARENAKKAVKYEADNKWYLQTLGDIYQMEEKYDSAVMINDKALTLDRSNANLIFRSAALSEKIGNYEKALEYLDRIDRLIGISKEVSMARYEIYEAMKMPEKAVEQLKIAAELSPEEYQLKGIIAEFYQRHYMNDSAAAYYHKIFPENRSDVNVVFSYSNFLLKEGKTDSARLLLLEIMYDKRTDHLVKGGYFYNVLRDDENFRITEPVIDTITKAFIQGHENDIRSLSVYADVFLRLRKYREAGWALKKIADVDGSNYPVLEQLMYVMNITGKTDSLLLYANRAKRLQPERPLVYLFSGIANYQRKDYPAALRELNRGLSLTDDNSLKLEFYSLLAECYQQEGKYSESESAFKNALLIDKDNIPLKNNYAYYLSLREKDLKYALKMSKSTVKAEPENSTYLDTYAWILFKMGKTQQAKKFILSAIENGGRDNEEILSHSAEIHIQLGLYAEAVKFLEKIISMPDRDQALKAQDRIKEVNSLMRK